MRFDATAPGVDEFLREYWSHVIFRKTLTPMHGVFRGYQTLLALYSFMKLAARLRALRAGRPVTSLEDVREGVRLVERAFVLHARYTDLFALNPMVTVMADRLYQQPSFVRTATLEAVTVVGEPRQGHLCRWGARSGRPCRPTLRAPAEPWRSASAPVQFGVSDGRTGQRASRGATDPPGRPERRGLDWGGRPRGPPRGRFDLARTEPLGSVGTS